jgi:hypothetical protein
LTRRRLVAVVALLVVAGAAAARGLYVFGSESGGCVSEDSAGALRAKVCDFSARRFFGGYDHRNEFTVEDPKTGRRLRWHQDGSFGCWYDWRAFGKVRWDGPRRVTFLHHVAGAQSLDHVCEGEFSFELPWTEHD